jgi:hypothetical protein
VAGVPGVDVTGGFGAAEVTEAERVESEDVLLR